MTTQTTEGLNNQNFDISRSRLIKGATYADLSTVMVVPTPNDGMIHGHVAEAMNNAIKPMNQKFAKFPFDVFRVAGDEVGKAYNSALANIKDNPEMSKWKFLLTAEWDNIPPPDGITKLQAAMYDNADKDEEGRLVIDADTGIPRFHFLSIGGLYWTKYNDAKADAITWMSQPMIYGHPSEPINFRPQVPVQDALQECHGVAMGWNIWNLQALLNDKRLGPPYWETKQDWDPMKGVSLGTQDLTFCQKAKQFGYRFAVLTSCKVGHMDFQTEVIW